ncbi:MAG: hypothetical protein IPP28_11425 [Xanthomonadales bacterium]|nr:hypothetical protein [Xanthomonadales bacterium]
MDKKHPILYAIRPRFLVPPITALGKAINSGIEFNRHGIIANGVGRIGKTEGLVMLSQTYDWRNWKMYWHSMLAGVPQQSTESYFSFSQALRELEGARADAIAVFRASHEKPPV